MSRCSAQADNLPLIDVFRPVVTTDRTRFTSPLNDLIQRSDNPLCRKREVHFDAKAFTIKVINHVQQPIATPVVELIVHEVHRPTVVDRFRHSQWLWLFTNQALLGLNAQVQLQLPVNPINPFVIPAKSFDVPQMQKAQAKAPVPLVMGQPDQPIRDLGILAAELCPIAIAGLADAEHPASQANTDLLLTDGFLRHLTATRRLYHFFSMASLRMSAFSRSSAYIFLSRRFSSSSSFNRAIMDASMPPNLARHL